MVSNQILQNTLDNVLAITPEVEMGVYDTEGNTLAATCEEPSRYEDTAKAFFENTDTLEKKDEYTIMKVYDEAEPEYVIIAVGEQPARDITLKMTVLQVESLLAAYRERYDKDNFLKNLILDNLLLVDIYNYANKLRIDEDARRIVFIIETETEKDQVALETVKGMYTGRTGDFITQVDEKNIILIKEMGQNDTYADMEKSAKVIVDMLNTEAMTNVRVSFGTAVNELKDVSRSYKEAVMALDVGKIFYSDKRVIAYASLGIGRLIYQLPMPLCKMFIREIFAENTPDSFDEETMSTIDRFFDESLNVSQTSRVLFVHRNTLVYRLDKIEKETGLDLRKFEDAITFKIAMMVVEYMKYMDSYDY